ncbi:hypothetical protein BDL97_03G128800 [Sphagnum fallax]|nr:hypothetical protein BDL97_03G128800 [Sphagnum fallax]
MQRLCFKQGWLSLAVSQLGQCSSFNSGFSITRGGHLKPMLLQELLEKVPPGLGVLVYIPLLQLPRSSFLGIFTPTKHNGMAVALCDKVMERMKDALWNEAHLSKHLSSLRRS